jgi:outer membrane receptor protein involved in Fe transport
VRLKTLLLISSALVAFPALSFAQTSRPITIEVPILVMEDSADSDALEPEGDLTQMVLSAAKRVQTVQENPSIVTVVTRNQIVLRGYETLSDVLDDVPGFEGYRPAFYFDTPDAFARGNGRTVLVLWNGVPLNSPQTNQRALGPYLSLDAIDRVEIVSGPGGVLWGANAVLGVASITTLRADRMGSKAEISGGVSGGPESRGAYHASATVADQFFDGGLKLYANLGVITSRGPILDPAYDIQITPFPAPDTDATVLLGPSTGDTNNSRDLWMPLTLAADIGHFKIDVLYPLVAREYREFNDAGARSDQIQVAGGMITPGPSSRRSENVVMASVQYDQRVSRASRVTARGYWTGFEDRWDSLVKYAPGLLSPEAVVAYESYTGMSSFLHDGAYRTGVTVDVSHDFATSQLIVGGEAYLEGIREMRRELVGGFDVGQPWVASFPGQRFVSAIYVDDKLDLSKRFTVDVGARGQYSPGSYDPLLLGSAAARWNPIGKVNLKFNAVQGFRPPPLALTNGNDDGVTNPYPHRESNPDLKAERSLSLEGELSGMVLEGQGHLKYSALRVGYQYTRLDDLVVFDTTGAPVNANRRTMNSVELRSDTAFDGGHRFVLGYSYLVGRDEETGPMRNIPQHRIRLTLEQRVWSHLDVFFGMAITGAVEDLNRLPTATSTGSLATPGSVVVDRLPPTGVVNFGAVASGLLDGAVDVALHVRDAFDAHPYIADPDFERRQAILPMEAAGLGATLTVTWRM